jgi:hypothetical protein
MRAICQTSWYNFLFLAISPHALAVLQHGFSFPPAEVCQRCYPSVWCVLIHYGSEPSSLTLHCRQARPFWPTVWPLVASLVKSLSKLGVVFPGRVGA